MVFADSQDNVSFLTAIIGFANVRTESEQLIFLRQMFDSKAPSNAISILDYLHYCIQLYWLSRGPNNM